MPSYNKTSCDERQGKEGKLDEKLGVSLCDNQYFEDKFKNDNGVLLSNFNDAIVVLHFRCVGRMSHG